MGDNPSEKPDSGNSAVNDENVKNDDEIQDVTDLCAGCGMSTRGAVRIQCRLCDKLWHAACVKNMNLKEVSTQEDIDAMRIELMCCVDNLVAV